SPVDCQTEQYGAGNEDRDYQFRTYGYEAPLFKDGFESGNLGKWDKNVGKTSLGIAEFSAEALCKLCVVGPGSLVGSKSLKVKIPNNKARYVQDTLDSAQSEYHARFKIKRGTTLKMGKLNSFKLLVGKKGTKTPFYLEVRRKAVKFQIRGAAKKDGAGFAFTPWTNLPKAATWVEVDLKTAKLIGGSSGHIKLYINNVLKVKKTEILNETHDVKAIRLGIAEKIKNSYNISGTFLLDGFKSDAARLLIP
ncbi:MAG: hypothetical protein N2D54_08990, partial [Chloroflexota bacterium]